MAPSKKKRSLRKKTRANKEIGPVLMDAFPFAGWRCERMTEAVMKRLGFTD